jgi:integrase
MKGSVQKRGEKCYRIRLDLGRDDFGKRVQKSVTVRGTRRDAEKRLTELLSEVHQGSLVNVEPKTLSEYLNYWLENYVSHLAARTYENYRAYAELIRPYLGRYRLDQLQSSHIQAFYAALQKSGRKRGSDPLSATTIRHTHRVLRGALQQAIHWQLLVRNPADTVTPPRVSDRTPRTLTLEQAAHLLEAARDTRYYIPILMALCTGMRRGEICGLRWQDVDLAKGVLAIQQTRIIVKESEVISKSPKTRTGRRALPIPTVLVEALQEEKKQQETIRLQLGTSYNAEALVVCREDGKPVHPHTLYKSLRTLLQKLGLPHIAFHDLRHSHATHLLLQGVNPKVVSERLGHSDPALTLRVYSHVTDTIQQEAANLVDTALREAITHHRTGKENASK